MGDFPLLQQNSLMPTIGEVYWIVKNVNYQESCRCYHNKMVRMCLNLKLYLCSLTAATAIEYALIAAGIAMAISASVFLFGTEISTLLYDDLPKALKKP